MRVLKSLVLVLALAGLSGCGSDSEGTALACSKGITSSWDAVGVDLTLDLRTATIGFTKDYVMAFSDGSACNIEAKITGQECTGNINASSSVWDGNGPGDPGCGSLENTSSYTISGATMVACDVVDTTVCTTYE